MPTSNEMNREIEGIDLAWRPNSARLGRYGNVIRRFHATGVRGIQDISLDFEWPVTVIAGTNGSGKTTILQLCSAAYQNPNGGGRNYRIGEWVRHALGEQSPVYGEVASVEYHFEGETSPLQIPYVASTRRWGYPRRGNPTRQAVFFGVGHFSPRIEKKDRLNLLGARIGIRRSTQFTAQVLQSISTILGTTYEAGCTHLVGTADEYWTDTVAEIQRGNRSYGEPHMGAGEQKVVRMVTAIEALPDRSLVLLEEPEITLHPDAQHGLAWYLMNVAKRKGHQIIVSTHSTVVFNAIPSEGRILLVRELEGTVVIPRAPEIAAARELAGAVHRDSELILVEDDVGKQLVLELLRRYNRNLLRTAKVVVVGDTNQVRNLVQAFSAEGCRVVGVRDPDIGGAVLSGLVSLPGNLAPEAQLLDGANLVRGEIYIHGLRVAYGQAERAGLVARGSDRAKRVLLALADELRMSREQLIDRLASAWIDGHTVEAENLVRAMDSILHPRSLSLPPPPAPALPIPSPQV